MHLTPREKQILAGLASGLLIKEISERLGISSKYIENCRTRINKKLNARGRVDLTHYALAHGLVENIYSKTQ